MILKKQIGTRKDSKGVDKPVYGHGLSDEEASKYKSIRYNPKLDDYEAEGGVSTEKWRLEIILEEDGLLDQVNGAVSQSDKRTQKAWNKAPSINRYSKALEGIRKGLGLTHEQVDDIFERANAIEI